MIRPATEPILTDWCAAMVPVIKKTGAMRICVNLKQLNTAVLCEHHKPLKLNPRKCVFRKTELTYFGHLIGGDGIKPDPERVEALLELSRANNVSELRTVLGTFQYLAKFVRDMSSVMTPMTDLLGGKAQQVSFDKTKKLLTTTTTLSYYDSTKPTVMNADASSYGIGAVLMQSTDRVLKPIAFPSRTLTTAEQWYAKSKRRC